MSLQAEACGCGYGRFTPAIDRKSYGRNRIRWSVGVILMEILLLDVIYVRRRDYPEFNLLPFRWAELRAPGRLSADGMDFLEMIVSPDPILHWTRCRTAHQPTTSVIPSVYSI
ncbi:hypothetical protein K438DRAFT_1965634 [Mycena galopus ATCC 62051]|nr:hypothetical protein K438DRAFT_1965634 [Mycena galopus ATCC 62051]